MAMAMRIPQVNSLIDYTTKTEEETFCWGHHELACLKITPLSSDIRLYFFCVCSHTCRLGSELELLVPQVIIYEIKGFSKKIFHIFSMYRILQRSRNEIIW